MAEERAGQGIYEIRVSQEQSTGTKLRQEIYGRVELKSPSSHSQLVIEQTQLAARRSQDFTIPAYELQCHLQVLWLRYMFLLVPLPLGGCTWP